MPSTLHMLSAVGVAAAITFALRAVPFMVIQPLRSSRLMRDLSIWMPGGLMVILLVYLVGKPLHQSTAHGILAVCSLALIVGLQRWRANALLSIFVGTSIYLVGQNLILG